MGLVINNVLFLFFVFLEDPNGTSASQAEKEEVDSRSIYVGNVSFSVL